MQHPKRIVITGASSGLGSALAQAYAARGVTLYLTGRDEARLQTVAAACTARSATVHTHALNITNKKAVSEWLATISAEALPDLVIANAGVSSGTSGGDEPEALARHVFAVNVEGVLNTILPVIHPMRERKSGQIAIMSSLAGYNGMPSAPAYSASKVAVKAYGEALRGWLAPEGVEVSVICPGFIRTPMTDVNNFPMPFLMDADVAADYIKRKLAENKGVIAFPFPMLCAARILSILPYFIKEAIVQRLPKK